MTNTFNTVKNAPGVIAKAAAQILSDELQFCKSIAKANEEDFKGKNGYSAGDTIFISKPARFIPQNTLDITSSKQDITEEKAPLTLDVISTVGVEIGSIEEATEFEIKNLIQRVIKPAAESIASDIESQFITLAADGTYNQAGTAGSTTFNTTTSLDAKKKLNQFLAPKDSNRFMLLDSDAEAGAVVARNGLFQDASEIAKQYKRGVMGLADGFTYMSNELLSTHTNGNDVTGVNVNGATQTGATLNVQGLTTTTGTVTKGSVFTIAGVFMVHPITKAVTARLQQFVVTADVTADGSGLAALAISPSIVTSGSLQTVTASPIDTAAMVFSGAASTAYVQNMSYHQNAFQLASVPLIMPKNAEFAAQETVDGLTIAIVRDFDVNTRKMITRLDFLGGLSICRPEWACRITA